MIEVDAALSELLRRVFALEIRRKLTGESVSGSVCFHRVARDDKNIFDRHRRTSVLFDFLLVFFALEIRFFSLFFRLQNVCLFLRQQRCCLRLSDLLNLVGVRRFSHQKRAYLIIGKFRR